MIPAKTNVLRSDRAGSSVSGLRKEPAVSELETSTLRHYLGVLWRRRWIVVLPVVVLAVLVYVLSKQQSPLYEASAQVLLNHQDQVATSLVGVQTPAEDAGRYAVTQTLVASTPTLAARVLAATGHPFRSATDLLNHTNVYSSADVLVFSVTSHDRATTARLASAYARLYTIYRRELDTRELSRTLDELEARIAALRADGTTSKSVYASLLAKAQDIRLLEALRQSNVYVIRTPTVADVDQIAPRPLRNATLAGAVGLLIGLVSAFLVDALDTRVRSAEELEESLGLPLLGSIPGRRARRGDVRAIPLLDDGDSESADAFLTLRTQLALANVDLGARTLLLAGCDKGEDASAVAASLGAATARTGRHVVLADLDLRDSRLTKLFGLDERDGATTVVLGEAALENALAPIELETADGPAAAASPGGSLRVLGTGALPARPGELVASAAVSSLLSDLGSRADIVLVVAPPLTTVGDAVALGSSVDALVVVARLGAARRTRIRELRRVLAAWPTATLGFVLTGANARARSGGGSRRGLGRFVRRLGGEPTAETRTQTTGSRPAGEQRAARSAS